jgi:hypothetical protein
MNGKVDIKKSREEEMTMMNKARLEELQRSADADPDPTTNEIRDIATEILINRGVLELRNIQLRNVKYEVGKLKQAMDEGVMLLTHDLNFWKTAFGVVSAIAAILGFIALEG